MPHHPNMSKQTHLLLKTMIKDPLTWHHNYEISKNTKLKANTLYPLLMHLTNLNYLTSKWKQPEQPDHPPHHIYHLTNNKIELTRKVAKETAKLPTNKYALSTTHAPYQSQLSHVQMEAARTTRPPSTPLLCFVSIVS